MKRELIEEDGFLYAKISDKEFEKLNKIEFDEMFIKWEEIDQVKKILNIDDEDDIEYVRAVRNSIVKYYGNKTSKYYCDGDMLDYENYNKYQIKLSAITCALDTILEA